MACLERALMGPRRSQDRDGIAPTSCPRQRAFDTRRPRAGGSTLSQTQEIGVSSRRGSRDEARLLCVILIVPAINAEPPKVVVFSVAAPAAVADLLVVGSGGRLGLRATPADGVVREAARRSRASA